MKASIICPLYNAEAYIEALHLSLLKQKNVEIESIYYILTESKDKTEEILNNLKATYKKISQKEFSHSKTREEAAFESKGEIIIFISQDIIIQDDNWLYNLTKGIINGECEAAFSRQICTNNTIEKYTRENNYSNESRIVSKEDIPTLGLMTFFFSDAASAIKKEVFVKLNGYDNKRLVINEDMYFAHKLITKGYRIKYCADSQVVHSHKFTLKQLFKRYYDTGIFLQQHSYLLEYGANSSGLKMAKFITKRALEDRNFSVLLNIIPNFGARFIGQKLGKLSVKNNK